MGDRKGRDTTQKHLPLPAAEQQDMEMDGGMAAGTSTVAPTPVYVHHGCLSCRAGMNLHTVKPTHDKAWRNIMEVDVVGGVKAKRLGSARLQQRLFLSLQAR